MFALAHAQCRHPGVLQYIDSAEPAVGSAGKFVVVTEHVVPLYVDLNMLCFTVTM